jgi:GTPase Era involved in 16S rRNA processing
MGSDVSRDEWINVAIVGQTRVGKGSFINAIRAIKKSKEIGEKGPDEFVIQGPSANVTHGMKPGPLIIEKYGYPDNENPIIYFYDTGGFGDAFNDNYYLEEWLKRYQRENRLQFDAIIFIIDSNKFTIGQIKTLKDQENKVCPVFYILNKIDILKCEINDELNFKNEKIKIKRVLLEILKKNDVKKHDFSTNNIYLISSKASKFEDEDVSPDGKRLKYNLEFFHFLKLKYDFYKI